MKYRVSDSCPADSVKAMGQPRRSQIKWILVVMPPRLRPNAWSKGSSDPPFCLHQRRRVLHERQLSRSSRSRDPSGHLHEAEVEAATRPPQRYRHHAIVGTWRRRYSKGHNVREGRATWRPSRGPKRCRSASVCRLFGACPSIEPVRQCLRSTAIGYQRFRSVLSYRTYAGCAWVTLAKMTFRTKPNRVSTVTGQDHTIRAVGAEPVIPPKRTARYSLR